MKSKMKRLSCVDSNMRGDFDAVEMKGRKCHDLLTLCYFNNPGIILHLLKILVGYLP